MFGFYVQEKRSQKGTLFRVRNLRSQGTLVEVRIFIQTQSHGIHFPQTSQHKLQQLTTMNTKTAGGTENETTIHTETGVTNHDGVHESSIRQQALHEVNPLHRAFFGRPLPSAPPTDAAAASNIFNMCRHTCYGMAQTAHSHHSRVVPFLSRFGFLPEVTATYLL